jgi:3-oxoacyl-[acyl-carrier-protein] synthase-3
VLHLRKVVPFIPEHSVAVRDLGGPLGVPDSEIKLLTRFLGLERIVTADGLSTLDMLLAVGQEALDGVDRSTVRHLIHAHTVQHLAPPGMRWMDVLRGKLALERARSFSLSHQGCVIGLYALKVAENLLRAEPPGSTALLLVGEKALSPVMQHIPGTSVLGDATAGVLVSLDGPGDAVLGLAHRTLGEYHRARHMDEVMEKRYHQIYLSTLASVMLEAAGAAGLGLAEIDLVLPHNVNRFSWTANARNLGLPIERIYLENVPKTGHCFCSDPFVNLSTARAEQVLRPDQTVLMVSAGQGGTFAAAVARTAPRKE